MTVDPLAHVHPRAELGQDVEIGPFSIVESGAIVGDGCRLAGSVVVKAGTVLGRNNTVFEGAVLGGMPQHIHMPENPGRVEIGNGNVIREHVTIHRSLFGEGTTRIGDGCLLMVNSHVAHDCNVGNGVILTNNVMLAGHVSIGDRAYLAGGSAVHQHCRVGRLAMVGGMARVHQDVPPFVTIDGGTTMVVGLNKVGLRRAGFDHNDLSDLKAAYQIIYRSGMPWQELLDTLAAEFTRGPASEFEPFFKVGKRGFVQERRTPPGATVKLLREDGTETTVEVERKAG